MSLLWTKAADMIKTGAWESDDWEEDIPPQELDGRRMHSELDHRHVQRLADSIRQHGYSPERHGQLGLNITDSGENVYHHASGSETHPEDREPHEHLLQALKDVGHGPVPVHLHDQSSNEHGSAPELYHGSTVEDLDEIRPNHSSRGTFGNSGNIHEPGYAYATSRDNAQDYAERASLHHGGAPHVYRVSPLGPIEKDPSHDERGNSRGNFREDVRSRHGFSVTDHVWSGHDPDGGHDEDDEDWG